MKLPGILVATCAVALLEACSGISGTAPVRAGIDAPLQSAAARALPLERTAGTTQHIYVTSFDANEILTFDMDGTPAGPTISGLNGPASLAVDPAGKLYVVNQWFYSLQTFLPTGQGATPTIYDLRTPGQVAVGPTGQIFISQTDPDGSNGVVRAFTAAGRYSQPTIHFSGIPIGVAVDEAGKIYVSVEDHTGNAFIRTFKPDGSPTSPTIALGPGGESFLAVSKGKLYAAQFTNNVITTYALSGRQTTPTITGLNHPYGVAIDRKGNIYVSNFGLQNGLSVTTYAPDGTEIAPTIRVVEPYGIAIH